VSLKAAGGGLSRREFLAAANAAAFLLLIESCSLGPIGRAAASPSAPSGSSPQERALKLLLDAIRASPDHLVQRAADLVASKDATRIVQFVRDSFSVLPTWGPGDDVVYGTRWGAAAALRGGQGTPRERASLLADMLTRAGFNGKVMSAKRPATLGLSDLYKPKPITFVPDQKRVDLARSLLGQSGINASPSPNAPDTSPDTAATILAALPSTLQKASVRDDLLPDRLPVVAFTDAGKTRYAFAVGDLDIMDSAPAGLETAPDAEPVKTVTVTVSGLCNPPPGSQTPRGKVVDLVSGEWPADRIFGRQMLLTFVPPQGPKAILEAGLSPFPVRLPTLRIQESAPSAAQDTSLTAVGSLITVQGDVLGAAAGGGFAGPFGPIQVLSAADRAQALARVASIHAAVNASAFPEIELEVALADASGAPVDGLDAASLSVMEDGAPVDFTVFSNVKVQPRPRVLVVSDAGSVELWPSAAAKSAFESGLESALVAQAAKTPFDVQVATLGSAPSPEAWAPPQAGSVAGHLSSAHEAADDPWISVGGPVLEQGVVAIVVISDFDAVDTDPVQLPTYMRRLAASKVPVFAIPIGAVKEAAVGTILSLSGGTRLDPKDPATPQKTAALLGGLASAWIGTAYRIRYQAPSAGPAQRAVIVRLAGRQQPQGNATYQVPAQPLPPPSFAGLYVTIKFGVLSAMRRLAGLEIGSRFGAPIGAIDDPVAVAETRAALDGITTIAFEPGTPTTAALLEDLITSYLSLTPLIPIWPPASVDRLLQAIPHGILRTPFALPALLRPTRVDPAAVPLMRVAIFQERGGPGVNEQHADLAVGMNPIAAITTDGHAAFKGAVATSVAACAAEAATYPDSAYARLAGRALTAIASGDGGALNAWIAKVPVNRQAAWQAVTRVYDSYHLVVPSAADADALWVVDPATGVAKAVLLDSTGGAAIRTACILSDADFLAIGLGMLSLFCMAVPNFSCVGVNVAAAGMTAVAMFSHPFNPLDPLAILLAFRPLQSAGMNAAFGIMIMMLVFENAGCVPA